MLRMRRITDQGFRVLVHLVEHGGEGVSTARSIAEETGLPAATTAKVLKVLQRSGLLSSTRGLCGGYALECDPTKTSIVTIIEAFEGPLGLTECTVPGLARCDSHEFCSLEHAWPSISDAVIEALRGVTLQDLIDRGAADPAGPGTKRTDEAARAGDKAASASRLDA